MKLFLTTCTAVIALAFVGPQAKAGSHSYWGHTHTTFVGPTGGYRFAPANYYPTIPRRSLLWHDTTHIDVVPGRWVFGPAGMTYIPPRRVLHIDGHYDAVPSYSIHDHHTHIH